MLSHLQQAANSDRLGVAIRLEGAMYHECWRQVKGGLANSADVDTVIREGLGLRWSFTGLFETTDLNTEWY